MMTIRHNRPRVSATAEAPQLPLPSSVLGITPGIGMVYVASSGPLGLILRKLNRFPLRGNRHRVELEIHRDGPNREIWTRRFGDRRLVGRRPLRSVLVVDSRRGLCECWGPFTLVFAGLGRTPTRAFWLRHSQIGKIRLTRRWLAIDVECTSAVKSTAGPTRCTSRTTIKIAVAGGRAGTLTYSADVVPEATP